MRLYLARHGETVLNQKRCYYGTTDVPLTEKGREQATGLGRYLKDMDLHRILSSPLRRAVETAELIQARREDNIAIESDSRLAEQNFGIFEGHTYGELKEMYPEELAAWNRDFTTYRIPDGESFLDVRHRLDDFLADLWIEAQKSGAGDTSVLITAHKGTLGHLLAACLRLPPEGYWHFVFEQGCCSVVDLEDGCAIIRTLNQAVPDTKETGAVYGYI